MLTAWANTHKRLDNGIQPARSMPTRDIGLT